MLHRADTGSIHDGGSDIVFGVGTLHRWYFWGQEICHLLLTRCVVWAYTFVAISGSENYTFKLFPEDNIMYLFVILFLSLVFFFFLGGGGGGGG